MPAIYRAALDDAEWIPLLRQLALDLASPLAALVTIDKTRGQAISLRCAGPHSAVQRDTAVDRFPAEQDLLYLATRERPPGDLHRGRDVLPFETLKTSPLYPILLEPLGVRESVAALVENDDNYYTCFGFWYRDAVATHDSRVVATLNQLVPHLAAAVRVNRRLREAQAAHWASFYSMQFSRHGVVMLNHRRRIMFANREAQRILRARDGLGVEHWSLVIDDPATQQEYDRHLSASDNELSGVVDVERRLRIARRSHHLPYDMLLVPRLGRPDYWRMQQGTAYILVISDPTEVFAIPQATLMRHYGLTQAEARLCRALMRTGVLSRAAAACDMAVNTARTHLKRIFTKLRVSTQLELFQWLGASIRPPVGGPFEKALLDE